MSYCRECGGKLSSAAQICASCGTTDSVTETRTRRQWIFRILLGFPIGYLGGYLASLPVMVALLLISPISKERMSGWESVLMIVGSVGGCVYVIRRGKSVKGIFRCGAQLGFSLLIADAILGPIVNAIYYPIGTHAFGVQARSDGPNLDSMILMEQLTILFTLICIGVWAVIDRIRPDLEKAENKTGHGKLFLILTALGTAYLSLRWSGLYIELSVLSAIGWVAIPVLWFVWYRRYWRHSKGIAVVV